MTRIKTSFNSLKPENRKCFVPYVTAGDPSRSYELNHPSTRIHAADILDLGVRFPDPMADGPVIQGASERASGLDTGNKLGEA